MNSIEQAQLDPLYAAMLRALQFQGKAEKTVEALRVRSGVAPISSTAAPTTRRLKSSRPTSRHS